MLWIPSWLHNKWRVLIDLIKLSRRRKVEPPPLPPPAPEPEPEPVRVSYNRAERRRLERRRRRHDKFVKPEGEIEPPPRPPTQQLQPKKLPRIEIIEDDDDLDTELYIHGHHHEDTEEVLYKESEMYGEFNFRDTILQQLERYFVYLARMKKHDADSFHFYRQIGATILPYILINADDRQRGAQNHEPPILIPLADWFNRRRPSFGCFVYGADPETEKFEQTYKSDTRKGYGTWVPKFMYFTKYKMPPPEIQMMSGGDIYKMTIWWDRPFDPECKRKYGTPEEFGIFISSDGSKIVALRTCETKWVSVASKQERPKGRRKGGRSNHRGGYSKRSLGHMEIPDRAYRIPSDYEKWAKEHGTDAQTMLAHIFLDSVQRYELAQYSMVRISASKDDMTAVFSVNIRRMSYFFQDRDITIAEHGQRRRIFHMVRAHTRRDGSVVKFHFRGERQFTWAGYGISITIPGRDHANINDFNAGADDEFWQDEDTKYVDMPELGRRFAEEIKHAK